MKPLADLPDAVLRTVKGVFTDIDDTLTTRGRLTAAAYAALERLHQAGLRVVPITGRPAGWCDHIARMWPVDAVVGENGALYFWYDHDARRLRRRFHVTETDRRRNRDRLAELQEQVLEAVPGCALASDQLYRESDLAIDYCEDVPPLDDAAVDRIVKLLERGGATVKVSSIHVNAWFGDYDKLGMCRRLLSERFAVDLERQREHYLYVGDSPNDAPMFAYFPHAVGVANIRRFSARLAAEPAYVTAAEAGAGFVELAERLLAARAAAP